MKARLSSTTALGPTGSRLGLGISSLRMTILLCQTLRRKSSNTWMVHCSPLRGGDPPKKVCSCVSCHLQKGDYSGNKLILKVKEYRIPSYRDEPENPAFQESEGDVGF